VENKKTILNKECNNCDWLKFLEVNYYCTEPITVNNRGYDYLNLRLCDRWKNNKYVLNKKLKKIKK